MTGSGPLGDLSVRLKLIYGLGMISRKEYEDAELVMALGEELFHDENDYRFTDDEILGPITELHCVTALPHPPERLMGGSCRSIADPDAAALSEGGTFHAGALSDGINLAD